MEFAAELGVVLALTLLNAFFSGAEIAILSVRKTRLRELADQGRRAARAAVRLRDDPERFLATVQVGVTVVGVTAGAFGGARMEAEIAARLQSVGFGTAADGVAFALVIALVSFLSIVLGELVPKSLALRSGERLTLLVARPVLGVAWLFRPLIWFLTTVSNLVLRPFRDSTTFTETRLSPDELQQLVEEASSVGALDARAGTIAARAIDLARLRISAVLVPRTEIASIARDAAREEVWQTLKSRPHARYPVLHRDRENVLGYVMARDLFGQLVDGGTLDLGAVLREVPFLPEQTPAVEALRVLQSARTQLAVVVDERGALAGLVTIEDITEELVGEILAEHEPPDDSIRRESETTASVAGGAPVHALNRELGVSLPESPDYSTLAGLLICHVGHIPRSGECIELPGCIRAEVLDASPRQVRRIRLHLPPVCAPEPSATEDRPSSRPGAAGSG